MKSEEEEKGEAKGENEGKQQSERCTGSLIFARRIEILSQLIQKRRLRQMNEQTRTRRKEFISKKRHTSLKTAAGLLIETISAAFVRFSQISDRTIPNGNLWLPFASNFLPHFHFILLTTTTTTITLHLFTDLGELNKPAAMNKSDQQRKENACVSGLWNVARHDHQHHLVLMEKKGQVETE